MAKDWGSALLTVNFRCGDCSRAFASRPDLIEDAPEQDPATGVRPHALWHKHVHNVELDPMQCLKMQEMDEHPNTVDY